MSVVCAVVFAGGVDRVYYRVVKQLIAVAVLAVVPMLGESRIVEYKALSRGTVWGSSMITEENGRYGLTIRIRSTRQEVNRFSVIVTYRNADGVASDERTALVPPPEPPRWKQDFSAGAWFDLGREAKIISISIEERTAPHIFTD